MFSCLGRASLAILTSFVVTPVLAQEGRAPDDLDRPEQIGYASTDSEPRPDAADDTPSYRFGYQVRGTIDQVVALRASGGQLLAADLLVRTSRGSRRVHLGSAFLDPTIPGFHQDDLVHVSGRMLDISGRTFFKVGGISTVAEGPLYPWPNENVLTGRVTDFSVLFVEDGRPRAALIDFRAEDGQDWQLLLGKTTSLLQPRIRLATGTEVAARGFVADEDGQRRFVAQSIVTPRHGTAPREGFDSAPRSAAPLSTQRAPAFVRGRLASLTPVWLRGTDHLLAQVEEYDGRTQSVNLGSLVELERLDPRPGERVLLLGFRDNLDGRPLLSARYLQLNERTVIVNRAATQGRSDGGNFASGEILELQPLEEDGRTEMLALVGLDTGGTAEILLGSRTLLEPLDLQLGSEVLVHGYPMRVRDRTVLQADHVRAADQTVAVRPATPQRDRRTARGSAARLHGSDNTGSFVTDFAEQSDAAPAKSGTQQVKRYTGEILSLRSAEFVGFDQPHLLASVRMLEGGGEVTVDLGPQRDVEPVGLAPGDQITVRGQPAEINAATGFVAYELTHAGQRLRIAQPEAETKARQRE